jgi:hypothetical protein
MQPSFGSSATSVAPVQQSPLFSIGFNEALPHASLHIELPPIEQPPTLSCLP